jgi:hypothetical protein
MKTVGVRTSIYHGVRYMMMTRSCFRSEPSDGTLAGDHTRLIILPLDTQVTRSGPQVTRPALIRLPIL